MFAAAGRGQEVAPRCPSASPCNIDGTFGYDAKAGDTATGCVPVLAPRGRQIEGVEYSLEGDAGYDRLHGEAVTWR